MLNYILDHNRWISVLLGIGLTFISGTVLSAPVLLQDETMQQVTAGENENAGGVIVGNSSDSQIDRNSAIQLTGDSQSGSQSLNLVNSSDSAVANTLNVWQGEVISFSPTDNAASSELEGNQGNQVHQQQLQSATLSGYVRSATDTTEIVRHNESQSFASDLVLINQVTDRFEEVRVSESSSDSMVDTSFNIDLGDQLYLSGHLGQGVASSGSVKALYDGGEAEFIMNVGGGISASASSSIKNEVLGSTASVGFDASIDLSLSLITTIELPRMEIELNGAGCGVILGSCSASGSNNELVMTSSDHSNLDVYENHQSGAFEFSNESISITRSPFELESARASYIVIDDASLTLESDETLALSESAQKDVKVMNLINAVSSDIANAVNVSRASQFENAKSRLILNQFNTVRHGQ
jgi:hypothetical protein